MDKSMQMSNNYKSGKLSLLNSKLSNDLKYYDAKSSLSFGVKNAKANINSDLSVTGEAFLDYNSGDEDEFALSLHLKSGYTKENKSQTIPLNPTISLSKTFDMSGIKSDVQRLSLQKSYLVANAEAASYDLKFKKRIYSAISSCIKAHSALLKANSDYNSTLASYNADSHLEAFTQGTSTQKQRESSLLASQLALKNAKISYDSALANFRNIAGFDYEILEFDEVYTFDKLNEYLEFNFDIKEDGNIDCITKKYDMLITQNEYYRVKGGGEKLKGELNSGYETNINSTASEKKLNADVHLNLSSSLYNIRIGGGVDYKIDDTPYPFVDLSFSISPDKSYMKDNAEREQKALDYQKAILDYSLSLSEYFSTASDKSQKLLNLKNEYRMAYSKFEYAKMQYENSKELTSLGYRSENEIESDKATFIDAKCDYIVSVLELITSVIDAEIFNM